MKVSMFILCVFWAFVSSAQDVKLTKRLTLNHNIVKTMGELAQNKAKENGWNVSIAIVDESANLVYFIKMDNAKPSSIELAPAKARSVAKFREDGKDLNTAFNNGAMVMLAIPELLPLDGGYLLKTADGQVVGAIGVSGSTAKNDGEVALAAVQYLKEIK
jgi:glc operon protein GlcG